MAGPLYSGEMDGTRMGEDRDGRFDELHAEAKAALGYSANTLDTVAARYRGAYLEELARYQEVRDELDALERRPRRERVGEVAGGATPSPEEAAEAGADDARTRALRSEVERLELDVGVHQSELTRLELAHRSLESAWLFLERGDVSLIGGGSDGRLPMDLEMRIVEAQEAERSRLAQEIHDGPAQALSNAVFQVEYIERVLDREPDLARSELRLMRDLLRRELGDVRTYISQLRPPLLDQLGLDGSIVDAAETMAALLGATVETDLQAPTAASWPRLSRRWSCAWSRRPSRMCASMRRPGRTTIVTRLQDGAWVVEIADDGRGFDVGAVASRGRRNFGLQFMRERAELIGATLDVSSGPDAGTIVRLAIPVEEESR